MTASQITIHGVLLETFGSGTLLLGESGIGKSECALDLIIRGHRLVADDAVEIALTETGLVGRSPDLTFEYLEIHGLGILNVRELYGVSSICRSMPVDLCIELKSTDSAGTEEDPDRTFLEYEILGLVVPKFVLPVRPGRTVATLVETAVRIYLAREAGYDAPRQLVEKHSRLVGGGS